MNTQTTCHQTKQKPHVIFQCILIEGEENVKQTNTRVITHFKRKENRAISS